MMIELRQIADDVHGLRPEWDLGGILTVLLSLRDQGSREDLASAAVRAAADPRAKTPTAISFGQYWQAVAPRPVTGGPGLGPLPECSACGQPASRKAALRLTTCPACGQPWVPTVFAVDRVRDQLETLPPNEAYRTALSPPVLPPGALW